MEFKCKLSALVMLLAVLSLDSFVEGNTCAVCYNSDKKKMDCKTAAKTPCASDADFKKSMSKFQKELGELLGIMDEGPQKPIGGGPAGTETKETSPAPVGGGADAGGAKPEGGAPEEGGEAGGDDAKPPAGGDAGAGADAGGDDEGAAPRRRRADAAETYVCVTLVGQFSAHKEGTSPTGNVTIQECVPKSKVEDNQYNPSAWKEFKAIKGASHNYYFKGTEKVGDGGGGAAGDGSGASMVGMSIFTLTLSTIMALVKW